MVKVNYFYKGFVGAMQTKEFVTKKEAEIFLESLKRQSDIYNPLTASIVETSS